MSDPNDIHNGPPEDRVPRYEPEPWDHEEYDLVIEYPNVASFREASGLRDPRGLAALQQERDSLRAQLAASEARCAAETVGSGLL